MTSSDAGTKLLPLILSNTPCCTCVNVTVLGEREPISGAGRALPQNGFNALLQPARIKRGASARSLKQEREAMGSTPSVRGQLQSISLPQPSHSALVSFPEKKFWI
jgi:hypothetical protein